MRVLVCGGREYTDKARVVQELDILHAKHHITAIIEGEQRGVDTLAREWAIENDLAVVPFPAQWRALGPQAGPVRNTRMLTQGKPDLVVAFPGGRGTMNMCLQARSAGIPVVQVYELRG